MKQDPFEDVCTYCGAHIGYGHPLFHLGNCGSPKCVDAERRSVKQGKPIKATLKKGVKL